MHVDRIEWDNEGKTITVKGLRPLFESSREIKISSEVKDPKLEDGILYLKLEGKGDTEFRFKIVFGNGVSIDPPLEDK